MDRAHLQRRTARPRARRAGAPAGPPPVLLEEREVGDRERASRRPRAGILGELRLPLIRRSVAGATLRGRLTWLLARAVEITDAAPSVRTIAFDCPGWTGHLPGQHVDVRLTAEDGYQAQRSYSIATPVAGERIE